MSKSRLLGAVILAIGPIVAIALSNLSILVKLFAILAVILLAAMASFSDRMIELINAASEKAKLLSQRQAEFDDDCGESAADYDDSYDEDYDDSSYIPPRQPQQRIAQPVRNSTEYGDAAEGRGSSVSSRTAPPVQQRTAQPVQQRTAQPVQQRAAQPVQQRAAQPNQQRPAQSAQTRYAAPVQQRTAQPVQQRTAQPMQQRPIQSGQQRPAQSAQTRYAAPVQQRTAQSVQQRPVQQRAVRTSDSDYDYDE